MGGYDGGRDVSLPHFAPVGIPFWLPCFYTKMFLFRGLRMLFLRPHWILLAAMTCLAILPAQLRAAEDAAQTFATLLPGLGAQDWEERNGPQKAWQDICLQAGKPGNETARKAVCSLMLAHLGEATPLETRVFLLRQLERVGGGESLRGLKGLVRDEQERVRDGAIRALANNPRPRAARILAKALDAESEPLRKISLVNGLAFHSAAKNHVNSLAPLLQAETAALASAAAMALGRIGGPDSTLLLQAALPSASPTMKPALQDAYLKCADRLLSSGQMEAAGKIYDQLAEDAHATVRLAVFQGQLNARGDAAGPFVLKVLAGEDPLMRQVAAQHVAQLPADGDALKLLVEQASDLPTAGRIALLRVLGSERILPARRAIMDGVKSEDESVKLAALEALPGVADGETVEALWQLSLQDSAAGNAAHRALSHAVSAEVDEALLKKWRSQVTDQDVAALTRLAGQRRVLDAVPRVLEAGRHSDAQIRSQAVSALRRLARADDVDDMVGLLTLANDAQERDEIAKAIVYVCNRITSGADPVTGVVRAYRQAKSEDRHEILLLLGRLGGGEALAELRTALRGDNAKLSEAALAAMANWPNQEVSEDLLQVASTTQDPGQKIRAIRGVATVCVRGGSDAEKLAFLKGAMQQTTRDEERKLILDRAKAARSVDTLRFVLPYVDRPALSENACRAVADLAHHRGLRNAHKEDFIAAMDKVVAVTNDAKIKERIEKYREDI